MKKLKNKVYPSPTPSPSPSPTPSSSSSSSSAAASSNGDFLSILNFLPVAILALVSVLSMEEREVLAYMMTRSKKTSAPFLTPSERKKKPTKKPNAGNCGGATTHAPPPVFDCDCFECYTSYWNRWNLSPNRELIHQAIDAYEDELEKSSKSSGKGKRRDKISRRLSEKTNNAPSPPQKQLETETETEVFAPEIDDVAPTTSKNIETIDGSVNGEEEVKEEERNGEVEKTEEETAVILRSPAVNSHKGLARKVLPDVLGLFNSRFWNLWGPN